MCESVCVYVCVSVCVCVSTAPGVCVSVCVCPLLQVCVCVCLCVCVHCSRCVCVSVCVSTALLTVAFASTTYRRSPIWLTKRGQYIHKIRKKLCITSKYTNICYHKGYGRNKPSQVHERVAYKTTIIHRPYILYISICTEKKL